jgi:chaperonin GroES
MKTYRLLSNHILVERIKRSTVTTYGMIVLPPMCEDDANTGGPKEFGVVAVGPGKRNHKGVLIPMECQPGDKVIVQSYTHGGVEVEGGGFVITDDMVLLVIPKEVLGNPNTLEAAA